MSDTRKIILGFMPQWSINQPPIGMAYLSAYLKKHEFSVDTRDFSIEMYTDLPAEKKSICESANHENYLDPERFRNTYLSDVMPYIQKWSREMAESSAPFLGFTVLSSNKIPTLLLIEQIKKLNPAKVIIVGGPHCTRYEGGFELATNPHVDFVVPDEGEEVLLELLEALLDPSKISLQSIKGILYLPQEARNLPATSQWISVNKGIRALKDDRIVDTGERSLISNIDELPMPDFDGFSLGNYAQLTIPILGSRGCIYKCSFCSETVLWKRFRFRTGENLFKEFTYQYRFNGVQSFYIVDSLINGNMKELESMCDLLIASKIPVYWGGKASIRKEMTKEILVKMYAAGCRNLDYGIESGSDKVVKDMKKGFDIPTAERVLRDSKEAGIVVGIFMMVGFPTESEADYQMSKDFILRNHSSISHVTPGYGFGVQPGSEAYMKPEKYGIVYGEDGWSSQFITPEILNFRVHDFRKFLSDSSVKMT